MIRPRKREVKTIDDCRRHFNKRWYQRVHIKLDSQFDMINKLIQQKIDDWDKFIEFVWKESNTRTHYRIRLNEKPYIVVYNRNVGSVTTIFPE